MLDMQELVSGLPTTRSLTKSRKDSDPLWKDNIPFYEYFHGDNGAGLGASHQTGWTGVVGRLIQIFGTIDAQQILDAGKAGGFVKGGPQTQR